MEILSSRVILRPDDHARTVAFYRDDLGLAIYRQYPGGTVFFAGQSLVEVAAHPGPTPTTSGSTLWLQVRDVARVRDSLTERGVEILREPRAEPWGLIEMWIADPDGVAIVLVEVPDDHPLRRDQRPAPDPQ